MIYYYIYRVNKNPYEKVLSTLYMPNLPVNYNIRPLYSWSVVLLSGADNRLLNVFIRLNTKVGRRLLNEYKRLMEDINIDNQ